MKKPRWLIVGLLTGVMAVGIMGGTALAHTNGEDGGSPIQSVASRVAGILGLAETDVQDALQQARTEMQNDVLQHRLDHKVEQGLITQEQADEYQEWYLSRPEGLSPRRHLGFRGFGGFHHRGGHYESAPSTEIETETPARSSPDLTSRATLEKEGGVTTPPSFLSRLLRNYGRSRGPRSST